MGKDDVGKLDEFLKRAEVTKNDDPFFNLIGWTVAMLRTDVDPKDQFEAADELRFAEDLYDLVSQIKQAAAENKDRRNAQLYERMLSTETDNFGRKGKTFYLTKATYVSARKDKGGLQGEQLTAWLEANGLGAIAKKTVNHQSLGGSVKTWLETNPIEAVEDGEFLEGEELYAALGFQTIIDPDSGEEVTPAEQYEQRKIAHAELAEVVDIGESPYVGIRSK